jgi:molybdenum cofactor biosynthesis protein B
MACVSDKPFIPVSFAVLTVSDTRSVETDTSGRTIAERLQAAGHRSMAREIVPDDLLEIRNKLGLWIATAELDVVLVTGGTGVTARDVTPEALAPLVTKPIPGFGELFRWLSYADIGPATIQSRAEAALCGMTLVFLLPGSTGAVNLALDKIVIPQLDSRTKPCNFAELLPRIRRG